MDRSPPRARRAALTPEPSSRADPRWRAASLSAPLPAPARTRPACAAAGPIETRPDRTPMAAASGPLLERRCALHKPRSKPPAGRSSDREAFAAFGATRPDHGAAPTGLHPYEKPVRPGALDFGGLVRTFGRHDFSYPERARAGSTRSGRVGPTSDKCWAARPRPPRRGFAPSCPASLAFRRSGFPSDSFQARQRRPWCFEKPSQEIPKPRIFRRFSCAFSVQGPAAERASLDAIAQAAVKPARGVTAIETRTPQWTTRRIACGKLNGAMRHENCTAPGAAAV